MKTHRGSKRRGANRLSARASFSSPRFPPPGRCTRSEVSRKCLGSVSEVSPQALHSVRSVSEVSRKCLGSVSEVSPQALHSVNKLRTEETAGKTALNETNGLIAKRRETLPRHFRGTSEALPRQFRDCKRRPEILRDSPRFPEVPRGSARFSEIVARCVLRGGLLPHHPRDRTHTGIETLEVW